MYPKLIALGTLVEPGKQCPSLGRDDGYFMVLTSKSADSIQALECHERDKSSS